MPYLRKRSWFFENCVSCLLTHFLYLHHGSGRMWYVPAPRAVTQHLITMQLQSETWISHWDHNITISYLMPISYLIPMLFGHDSTLNHASFRLEWMWNKLDCPWIVGTTVIWDGFYSQFNSRACHQRTQEVYLVNVLFFYTSIQHLSWWNTPPKLSLKSFSIDFYINHHLSWEPNQNIH